MSEGVHRFTAIATDADGHTSPSSSVYTITVDINPPAPPLFVSVKSSETNAPILNGGTTANTTPIISGTVEPGTTIALYDGNALVAQTTVDQQGNWTASLLLAAGMHTLIAQATDAAGNASPLSTAYIITIDANSPNKASPLQPQARAAAQPAPPVRAVQAPAAAAAPALIAPKATSLPATLALTIDTIPPATPAAPAQGPGPGPAQPQLSGTTEANSTVAVLDDGVPLDTVLADGTGWWTFTPPTPLAAGPYAITVQATDAAGNTSAASPALTLTIAGATGPVSTAQPVPALAPWALAWLSLLAGLLGWRGLAARRVPGTGFYQK